MENKVQQFLNDNFGEVRVIKREDESIWFVANDVAEVLQYDITTNMTRNLDDDEKDIQTLNTLGGNQECLIINESGLYNAVLSITKRNKERYEKSRSFKKWITKTVIPALRKDGAYIDGEENVDMNNEEQEAEFVLKAINILQNKIDRLQNENKIMKPKADYHDTVLNPTTYIKLVTSTEIGKDLGMSAQKLNKILNTIGIIYKKGKSWQLYSKYESRVPEYCDYVINEHGQTLKFTEKGRQWILNEVKQLKENI